MSILGNRNNKSEDIDITNKSRKKRGVFGNYVHYAVMPGIFPRIRALGRHFGHFAYLLALIYQSVRLIQPGHPVLNPANIGTFGFRDVFGAASDNLVMKRENFDQILMYFAVMAGFVMIIVQFLLILGWVGMNGVNSEAFAQTSAGGGASSVACSNTDASGFGAIFSSPCPESDLAFQLLRSVFGTDLFNVSSSNQNYSDAYNTTLNPNDNPVVQALQGMLSYFSDAMLVIAILIILYYVFTVVGEAAISGTPFGRRFDGFWAPIRIVFALGILVPLGNGYNTAQYATLYIAKAGSGLGTTAWAKFYEIANPQTGSGVNNQADGQNKIVSGIEPQGTRALFEGIILSEVCAASWTRANGNEPVSPDVTYRALITRATQCNGNHCTNVLRNPTTTRVERETSSIINISDGLAQSIAGQRQDSSQGLKIVWRTNGTFGINKKHVCGELTIPLDHISRFQKTGGEASDEQRAALRALHADYIMITRDMIKHIRETYPADLIAKKDLETLKTTRNNNIETYHDRYLTAVEAAQKAFEAETRQSTRVNVSEKGWAAAGLYYNQISTKNGQFYDAVTRSFPAITRQPHRLQYIQQDCRQQEEQGGQCELTPLNRSIKNNVEATRFWYEDAGVVSAIDRIAAANPSLLETVIASIFGLTPLFEFRNSVPTDPMAELAVIGRGITYHALDTFKWAIGFYGGSVVIGSVLGPFSALASGVAGAASAIAGLMFFVGAVGLSVGFLLFYIIPLMPFIYFFFAVANWVAEIFEAIVAMPLFALAHIRIDGGGLPGQAASGGYYLLFGIFIRPILIVFGMIAGILIFSATAIGLHALFDDALLLLSVKGTQSGIDHLAYSIIYTVLIYNLATTSFKLIDRIPEGILRWMGNSTPAFSDQHEDPIGNQQQVAVAAAGVVGTQLGGQLGQSSQGLQSSVRGGIDQNIQQQRSEAQNQEETQDNLLEEYGHDRGDAKGGDRNAPARMASRVQDQADGKDARFNKLSSDRQAKVREQGLATTRTSGTDLIEGGDIHDLGYKDDGNGGITENEWGSEQDRALDKAIAEGREIRITESGRKRMERTDEGKAALQKIEGYKASEAGQGKVKDVPDPDPEVKQGAAPPSQDK